MLAVNILKSESRQFILDGHFCLLNSYEKAERIPAETFIALAPDGIIVLTEKPQIIVERRKSRDGVNVSINSIEEFQNEEVIYATEVTKIISAKLFISRGKENHSKAIDFIKSMEVCCLAGKFIRKPFSAIDLNDSFFDSLKVDYPGSSSSTGFIDWFHKKEVSGDEALVFEDEQGLGAFVCLKNYENEPLILANGSYLPAIPRMKVSTIKIDDRYQNQRIGEGAIGLILWKWQESRVEEIYVTVFEKQISLLFLLDRFGFVCAGYNQNGERIYIKNRKSIDYSDPCKSFPFLDPGIQHAGCLAIDMDYHDTMFAFSDLARTLQERVDISVANGLKKVYIGSPRRLAFCKGDPVLIYRKYTGLEGKPGYKSVVTGYCVVTRIVKIKDNGTPLHSFNEYREMIGNKSVFNEDELRNKYNDSDNLTIIELVYYGYFGSGNNVNWAWLKNNGCWQDTHPMSFRYSRMDLEKILREGNIDVSNVIID